MLFGNVAGFDIFGKLKSGTPNFDGFLTEKKKKAFV